MLFENQDTCASQFEYINLFFLRNYRKRLFQQSDEFNNYWNYLKNNPSERSTFCFDRRAYAVHIQRKMLDLFIRLTGKNGINEYIEKEYRFSLIDLMVEDDLESILNSITVTGIKKSVCTNFEENKFDCDYEVCAVKCSEEGKGNIRYINVIASEIYIPEEIYFTIQPPNYQETVIEQEVNFKLDICDDYGMHLYNKINNEGRIQLKELFEEKNDILMKVGKDIIDFLKGAGIEEYTGKYEEYVINAITVPKNKLDYLLPLYSKINKKAHELLKTFTKITKPKYPMDEPKVTKDKNYTTFLTDINSILNDAKRINDVRFMRDVRKENPNIHELISFCEQESKDKLISQEKTLLRNNGNEKYFKLSETIYQSLFYSEKSFKDIHNANHFQNIKNRIIGLYIYDKIDNKSKTIPTDFLTKDKILKLLNFTVDDKIKLNNYYKTTKRCIEYGHILPIKA